MTALLTTTEMAKADRLTIEAGMPGIELMDSAGFAVADVVAGRQRLGSRVLVIAGPGNNGGDGFIAAQVLRERGYPVRLMLMGERDRLTGDAAEAARRYRGPIEPADPAAVSDCEAIVDALFGAGLARPLDGTAAALVAAINGCGASVVAVDLPSGVSGDSGHVLGTAVRASETVTFFRKKPGHLLEPGRTLCGRVRVVDIGIGDAVLAEIAPQTFANGPDLWRAAWRPPGSDGNKFDRGHAVAVCGPAHATGAARLAATAALRAGAGLVTVASPPDAVAANAAHLTAVMLHPFDGPTGLAALVADRRITAVVAGPGLGVGEGTRALVKVVLAGNRAVVLDADALTSFRDDPTGLAAMIAAREGPVVMTPHEGEFARLFPDLGPETGAKTERARAAARRMGAVVVLKGPDTVVAASDGRAAINENAPPWLATAGSGDVLAGTITGLLAGGMAGFEAATMGVWMHGEAGTAAGPGLIAEDLVPALKTVVAGLPAG
jgi:hydroxyethylthiazole kinase-like uncharacterized protein yjeF